MLFEFTFGEFKGLLMNSLHALNAVIAFSRIMQITKSAAPEGMKEGELIRTTVQNTGALRGWNELYEYLTDPASSLCQAMHYYEMYQKQNQSLLLRQSGTGDKKFFGTILERTKSLIARVTKDPLSFSSLATVLCLSNVEESPLSLLPGDVLTHEVLPLVSKRARDREELFDAKRRKSS